MFEINRTFLYEDKYINERAIILSGIKLRSNDVH